MAAPPIFSPRNLSLRRVFDGFGIDMPAAAVTLAVLAVALLSGAAPAGRRDRPRAHGAGRRAARPAGRLGARLPLRAAAPGSRGPPLVGTPLLPPRAVLANCRRALGHTVGPRAHPGERQRRRRVRRACRSARRRSCFCRCSRRSRCSSTCGGPGRRRQLSRRARRRTRRTPRCTGRCPHRCAAPRASTAPRRRGS